VEKSKRLSEATLGELVVATTKSIKERLAANRELRSTQPPGQPVDCPLLLAIIESAQQLYAENCAGGP